MTETDKSHVEQYVSPEGPRDDTPSTLTDRTHVVNYTSPEGPRDPDAGGMDRSHVKFYVTPLPGPEEEPEPDPDSEARKAWAQEVAAHAELVRRMQEEDRKRAAKSVEPTSLEGQD